MHTPYQEISIKDFTYDLPDDKIAKYPLQNRDESKLLMWQNGQISDHQFNELSSLVPSGSMLVFNNTRVIRARLIFKRKTGAKIEIFCLEPTNPKDYALSFSQTSTCKWKCIVGNLKKWKNEVLQRKIAIDQTEILLDATKGEAIDGGIEITFSWNNPQFSFAEILEASGNIPIPPYLNRDSEATDLTSYQTVYSKIKGSVAAPTAGLHFTEKVFDTLKSKNISCEELTLHVGAGTFQPVKAEKIGGHQMHTEHFSVTLDFIEKLVSHNGKIIAVGTTSVRTLESLYQIGLKIIDNKTILPNNLNVSQWEAYQNEKENFVTKEVLKKLLDYMIQNNLKTLNTSTQIIILPGYRFKVIDGIITNFHQPQSTLLLLIGAFLGENWRMIYNHALKNNYRFLSYGDSNLYLR